MNENHTPRFVYLTTPQPHEPVLNIGIGEERFLRCTLSYRQLVMLNAQIADAILKYKTPAGGQPVLSLD